METASLKDVGIHLGDTPRERGSGHVSMLDIVEYFDQKSGFIPKDEFPDSWESKGSKYFVALNNAFNSGYILKGMFLKREYYGIPSLPKQELISLKDQFRQLRDPDEKRELMNRLIEKQVSSSQTPLAINQVLPVSNNLSEEVVVKQSSELQITLENLKNIKEQKKKTIQEEENKIPDFEEKLIRQKQIVKDLKDELEKFDTELKTI
ncbi:hypothetical protein [Nostoc sp.]|uniref:hypothetical protein n=1 Tax=Nostoc sp. TaxID=1180 RepID=UPI002FF8FEA3